MRKPFVIAEIGINHNGDLDLAKKLIAGAADAGCDAVKFQKRTIEEVYSKEELDQPRESPWGTTNREQKLGLEFTAEHYAQIDSYCRSQAIAWFASAWDIPSQLFLRQYGCDYNKIASALLTHRELLETVATEKKHTFISTGMSTLNQIQKAVDIFRSAECSFELMHCNSTYPMPIEEANLLTMETLREKFTCDIGYSGHETGIAVSLAAAAMGATSVERHITIDRSMYGSDQAASLELVGLSRLVKDIRAITMARGDGIKRVTETEKGALKKLRKFDTT